jgi:hypothetical protein
MSIRTCAALSLVAAVAAQYGAMELPAGLSPRYYLGGAQLLERQAIAGCTAGQHPCKYSALQRLPPEIYTDR